MDFCFRNTFPVNYTLPKFSDMTTAVLNERNSATSRDTFSFYNVFIKELQQDCFMQKFYTNEKPYFFTGVVSKIFNRIFFVYPFLKDEEVLPGKKVS